MIDTETIQIYHPQGHIDFESLPHIGPAPKPPSPDARFQVIGSVLVDTHEDRRYHFLDRRTALFVQNQLNRGLITIDEFLSELES